MTVEILSIAVLCVILLLTTFVQGSLVPLTHGFRWGLGSRNDPVVETAVQGRFARCVQNQIEAICIYVPITAIVVFLDRTSELSAVASWLVIVGRALFVPFYVFGVFGLRSVAYGVATVGLLMMAFSLV